MQWLDGGQGKDMQGMSVHCQVLDILRSACQLTFSSLTINNLHCLAKSSSSAADFARTHLSSRRILPKP